MGPLCDDSLPALDTLAGVAAHYTGKASLDVRVLIHPLPENQGSWLVAQTCTAVGVVWPIASAATATIGTPPPPPPPPRHLPPEVECLRIMYADQLNLRNLATFNLTAPDMIGYLIAYITSALPELNRTALWEQLDFRHQPPIAHYVPRTYNLIKNNWKYGASRGVWKTPTFLINNVAIGGADPDRPGYDPEHYLGLLSVDEWVEVLDPIVFFQV